MKREYIAPSCETLSFAKEEVLNLFASETVASFDDGPTAGFDLFS